MKEQKKHSVPRTGGAAPETEEKKKKEPKKDRHPEQENFPGAETAAEEFAGVGAGKAEAGLPEAEAPEAKAPETEPKEPSELEKTQRALAELGEKYVYLQAEYQNYRKRVSKELAGVRSAAIADTLTPFLTVCDFLNMADVAAANSDNIESIRQGLKMILGEFNKAFDELGVKSLSATGEKFDPALHEAVASENSDSVPEGVVIRQWSSGFKLGEKLLRPARVVVSAGPAKAEPEKGTEEAAPAADDGKEA